MCRADTCGKRRRKSRAAQTFRPRCFPHFFPQLWKSLPGSALRSAAREATVTQRGPDADERSRKRLRRIDTASELRYYLSFSAIIRSRQGDQIMKRTFQPNRRRRRTHPRLPGAHGHEERPPGAEAPPRQGAQEAHRFVRSSRTRPRRDARRACQPCADSAARRSASPETGPPPAEFPAVFDLRAGHRGAILTVFMSPNDAGDRPTRDRRHPETRGRGRRNRAKRLIREVFRQHEPCRSGPRHRRHSAAGAVRRAVFRIRRARHYLRRALRRRAR